LTRAAGAGHGDEGDASFQGPAQEQIETLPAQPKPTNAETSEDAPGPVIELAARAKKSEAAEVTAVTRAASGLVMTRPKPEKRLNAKDRAKARREKNKPEAVEEVAVAPEAAVLATAHPKPEKRKNAKERAKEKYAKAKTEDGTTPMTAKAKSKVETKAKKTKAAKAA
jgi:hypothetical protein